MSKEAIDLFREKVNLNTEWQEDVRQLGVIDLPEKLTNYANEKGYKFTEQDYKAYLNANSDGQLSEFEMEMVVGGSTDLDKNYDGSAG